MDGGIYSVNQCGGCTACCKTRSVPDLPRGKTKEAGRWCEHCIIGRGCGIYPALQGTCSSYRCFWTEGGPPEHRPDRMKIIVDGWVIEGWPTRVVCLREVRECALEQHRTWVFLESKRWLDLGHTVVHVPIGHSGRRVFVPKGTILPEGAKEELLLEGVALFDAINIIDLRHRRVA